MEISQLLQAAVERRASDILLVTGAAPMFRIRGDLASAPFEALTPVTVEQLVRQLLDDEQAERLQREKDVDFAIAIPGLGRFRVNVHCQRGSYAAALRHVPGQPPDLESLHLPRVIEEFTRQQHGLVLVTGQTGSGKSTTLAAMIDLINHRDPVHIITLEDPIEFQFAHARALIEQREIGSDCPSFASGLKHVLRQDPDVILVGELRDLETIRTALQAAETGHLVFATLHSNTAAGAIDRIIDVFPAGEQAQIRSHLGECLKGVITQRLVPSADGRGRIAAVEVLVANRPVQTSIREATTHLIAGMISTGRRAGMQTMEQALNELMLNGRVLPEDVEECLVEVGRG